MSERRSDGPGNPLQAIVLVPIAVAADYMFEGGHYTAEALRMYHEWQSWLAQPVQAHSTQSVANSIAGSGILAGMSHSQMIGLLIICVAGVVMLRTMGAGMNKAAAKEAAAPTAQVGKAWMVPGERALHKKVRSGR